MPIQRRTKAAQSATQFLRTYLYGPAGFAQGEVVMTEAFPGHGGKAPAQLNETYVATGYNSDDGGRQAETGSDLARYVWRLEWFVFGKTRTWAENVADQIAACFEPEGVVPVLDIGGDQQPTGDLLVILKTNAQRVVVRDPRPWELNVYLVRTEAEDYFFASSP